MARIGEMLGWGDNPWYQMFNENRSAVSGAARGAMSNPGNPWAGASYGMEQGGQADEQRGMIEQQEAEREAQINQTAAFLRSKGAEDLAAAVEGGMTSGSDAFNQWYAQSIAQPETAKPTSAIQEYEYARQQGYGGTFQEYETAMKQAGATNIDFNQNQGVAAGFADRMAAANAVLADPKLTPAQTDPMQQGLGSIPGVGNYLTSAERQMAEQAQRDFVNAILRRESGAAIAPSEFENASKQYFPQPGDSEEVIAQKARNREIAIQGVMRAAGPSYAPPPAMEQGGVVDYTTYFGGQ